ncbi:MAG: hypothetical protein WBE50_02220, partial [Methyloceanibacter sp.]
VKNKIALTFATLLLAATPALAENPAEPSDKVPGVTPNDAALAPPVVMVPAPEKKNTCFESRHPDPTKNTPGAESKD